MFDGHLNDLCLLNPAPAFLEVRGGNEAAQVGKAIIHPIPASLFDNSV